MHIRCPHCHNAIEIVEDSSFRDVECSSCGSHFNLVGSDAPTESGPSQAPDAGPLRADRATRRRPLRCRMEGQGHDARPVRGCEDSPEGTAGRIRHRQVLPEARAAAQLRHPNIVGVHEVGREGDTIFIASDYVEGATLRSGWAGSHCRHVKLLNCARRSLTRLHVAHEAGVVHRDLKPQHHDGHGRRTAHHGLRVGETRFGRDHGDRRGRIAGNTRLHAT